MMQRIARVIFLLMITELCVGGGGRFTAIGPVSLRMVLFSIALVITVVLVQGKKRIPADIAIWMIGFAAVVAIGVAVALLHQNSMELVYEDVKPLCYFFVLPFFYLAVDQPLMAKAGTIIKTTSLAMALIFILLLALINTGVIHFLDFYRATLPSQELFYRGEATFFYKGFLFFGIGAIFCFFTADSRMKKIAIPVLVIAILLSVTRGLFFSLALTFAAYFMAIKLNWKAILGVVLALATVVWGSTLILAGSRLIDAKQNHKSYSEGNPNLLGDRNYSDNGRRIQAAEVWQQASLSSTFIGHGFGSGTTSRPVHMEVSYLEIFHKQGLIGLIFWAAFAGLIFANYRHAPPSPLAHAFFYSAVFIFIESVTNQYINNPIGMSMLLLSLVSLYKMKIQK